jgi:hypothetical protein
MILFVVNAMCKKLNDISAIVDMYYHPTIPRKGSVMFWKNYGRLRSRPRQEDDISAIGHTITTARLRTEGLQPPPSGTAVLGGRGPVLQGSAIAAIDLEGAEMEVAEIETTCLPWGLKLKGGKFFSDFGYINAQHAHQWDFTDQPLIYQLALGVPRPERQGPAALVAGADAVLPAGRRGGVPGREREHVRLSRRGPLPDARRPARGRRLAEGRPEPARQPRPAVRRCSRPPASTRRSTTATATARTTTGSTATVVLGRRRRLQVQRAQAYGQGDVIVQAEYFSRKKDLDLVAHDLAPHLVGNSRVDEQDGYYVQASTAFLPRWRAACAGSRWA